MESKTPLRVLLIEDDPEDVLVFRRHASALTAYGLEVDRAEDAEQASSRLSQGEYDLVFLDLRLGKGQAGTEILERLVDAEPETGVIVLTGKGDEQSAVGMMKAGATDYLTKDTFNSEVLERCIRYALSRRAARTEHRRAEEALRESQATLARAQRIARLGSWQRDLASDTATWSDEVYRIFGLSPAEADLSADGLLRMAHPDDRQTLMEARQRLIKDKEPLSFDYRVVRPDGTERVVHLESEVQCDETGQPVRVVGTVQDVTERKHAEEEIAWLARFPSESPDPVLRISEDGTVMYANAAAEPLMQSFGAEVSQQLTGTHRQWIGDLYSGGESRDVEVECAGRVYSLMCAPIAGAGYVNVYGHDITQRKRAEEALRESEDRLRTAFEAAKNVSFVTVDLEGTKPRILDFSPGAESIFGYSREEVVGRPLAILHPPEQVGKFARVTELTLQREGGLTGEMELVRKSGDRFAAILTTLPIFDADGNMTRLLGVSVDITERKRAERELEQSHEQLRALAAHLQSVREEERAEMAREIHDGLGHALASLRMDLSSLHRMTPEEVDERHEALRREKLSSMAELVDTTISTVRQIATELRPGVLDDLGLAAAIEWQVEEFQERTGVECEFACRPEEIALDRERSTALFRICQEILTNVARHAGATAVNTVLEKKPGRMILVVHDNGRGITEEEVRSSRSLGILGMRERALAFGGTVEIVGTPGEGTTFTVSIPLG